MKKNVTMEFYVAQVGPDGTAGDFKNVLHSIAGYSGALHRDVNGTVYEVRGITKTSDGYRGAFVKYRLDELPHAGAPGGIERELQLARGEGLLEKNHFRYYNQHDLVVYQRNGHGSTPSRFAAYLTEFAPAACALHPVLNSDPTAQLLSGKVIPRRMELSFARPKNKSIWPQDEFSKRLFGLISESGGVRMSVQIAADARSKDANDHSLATKMKSILSTLSGENGVSVARMIVEEEGVVHPIDLIADRLLSDQVVEFDGKYPRAQSMYVALEHAKKDRSNELKAILG